MCPTRVIVFVFTEKLRQRRPTETTSSFGGRTPVINITAGVVQVGDFNAVHATSEVDEVDSEERLFFAEETIAVIKVSTRGCESKPTNHIQNKC